MTEATTNPRLTRLAIHTRAFQETCEFYTKLLAQEPTLDPARPHSARFEVPGGLDLEILASEAETQLELGFAHLPAATIQALERTPGLTDPLGNLILPTPD